MCRANRRWNASEMGTAWLGGDKCLSSTAARRLQSRNNVRGTGWWRGNTKAHAVRRGQLSPQARGLDMGVDLREMDETQGTDRWVAELDGLSDRPKGEDGC